MPGSSTSGVTVPSSRQARVASRRRRRVSARGARSEMSPMPSVTAESCGKTPSIPVKLMVRCASRSIN